LPPPRVPSNRTSKMGVLARKASWLPGMGFQMTLSGNFIVARTIHQTTRDLPCSDEDRGTFHSLNDPKRQDVEFLSETHQIAQQEQASDPSQEESNRERNLSLQALRRISYSIAWDPSSQSDAEVPNPAVQEYRQPHECSLHNHAADCAELVDRRSACQPRFIIACRYVY